MTATSHQPTPRELDFVTARILAGVPGRRLPSRPPARRAPSAARPPRAGTTIAVALEVLREAGEPLTARQIYERAGDRLSLGGKDPVDSLTSRLHAALGRHLERPSRGRYALIGD